MTKGSKHSTVSREKMGVAQRKNPTRYWLGKKLPLQMIEAQKMSRRNNGKRGNVDYFKKHKFVGANHKLWKGDNVGYDALHTWLYRRFGRPETCQFCKKGGLKGRKIHWANKSGDYKRVKRDWLRLCAKCHYHYDRD